MATSLIAVESLRPRIRIPNYDSDLLDYNPTQQQWPCILCTYLNDSNTSKCGLCLTSRTIVTPFTPPPRRKRKPRPPPRRRKPSTPPPRSNPLRTHQRSISTITPPPRRTHLLRTLARSISTVINEETIVAQEPPANPQPPMVDLSTMMLKTHTIVSFQPPPVDAASISLKTIKEKKNRRKYTEPKKATTLYPLPATTYGDTRSQTNSKGTTNFSIGHCLYGHESNLRRKPHIHHRNSSLIALQAYEKSVQEHECTLLEILKYCVMENDVVNTITDARCDVLCHFLPLIAFTLCQSVKFEFKMKLLNQLRNRIVGQADVRQSVKFFINSYHDIECVKSVFNGICNDHNGHIDKDPVQFWQNIIKRKDVKDNESIKIPLNMVLRDPVKQLSSPMVRVVIKKVINSNSKPLLIDCYGSDTTNNGFLSSTFILKYGDDLRKDKSCMLMFKWINYLFIKNENDKLNNVKILTYNVVPMSNLLGCIQLIPDCVALRNILCLQSEIKRKPKLLNNLIASAAGSYISSYIMGVRDRHFDNILIRTTDCTLFHIDMGYVLGDTITGLDANKFGITKEFHDILGRDNYKLFIDLSIHVFCELRDYHQELINFACLAFSYVYDYAIIRQYISSQLRMHESDKKAVQWLRTQLENAPFNKQTILKNVIHKYATR